MQIGEFARRAGVSARALRHYEDAGLLAPGRTASGYRDYDTRQLAEVARIRFLLAAGLGVESVRHYLECVGDDGPAPSVEMCAGLRASMDDVEARLTALSARIDRDRAGLARLRESATV